MNPFTVGLAISEAGAGDAFSSFLTMLTSFITWLVQSLGTIGEMVMKTPLFLIPFVLVIVGAVIAYFKTMAH